MTNLEILNQFGEYVKYDPGQRSFDLFSDNYKYHKAGKTIECLLDQFDPSGEIAVIYAKAVFENVIKSSKYSVKISDLVSDKNTYDQLRESIEKDIEMHDIFYLMQAGRPLPKRVT